MKTDNSENETKSENESKSEIYSTIFSKVTVYPLVIKTDILLQKMLSVWEALKFRKIRTIPIKIESEILSQVLSSFWSCYEPNMTSFLVATGLPSDLCYSGLQRIKLLGYALPGRLHPDISELLKKI